MGAQVEKTLALIKPDAVKNGDTDNILQAIEKAGFTVVTKSHVQLTAGRAAEFYAEHTGKPFFEKLCGFMSSGPLVALVLAKSDAIPAWRALMGPTNSLTAKEEAPDSLRARFGTDGTMNATHGSDSPASASREMRFYFPKLVQDPLPDTATAQAFIAAQLQPTLVKALTAFCKAKPTADKLEAITWVATWLLDNNPNKARSMEPGAEAEGPSYDFELEGDEPDVEAMEEHLAATQLQAHFRGYVTRKNSKARLAPVVVVQSHEMSEEEKSAVKIQAIYRGHATRKNPPKGYKAKAAEEAAAAVAAEA